MNAPEDEGRLTMPRELPKTLASEVLSAAADLTRDERSCLLYLETRAVDEGGLCEGVRMNAADLEACQRFVADDLLDFSRIPACLLGTGGKSTWTHIVRFKPSGWALAHAARQSRAERLGPHSTEVVAELVQRGKWAANLARSEGA